MKRYLILSVFFFNCLIITGQDVIYQHNEKNGVFYERVIACPGKSKTELHQKVSKYFAINGAKLRYSDDNEIYATGKFETKFRFIFLIFFNTKEFDCVYDIEIKIKENKIKYTFTNFVLVYKHYNITTNSWYGNKSDIGSFGWSTTKIPTEIPTRKVDHLYDRGLTKKKRLLFPSMDKNINEFVNGLKNTITENEDDW